MEIPEGLTINYRKAYSSNNQITRYFICARGGQCGRPCEEHCFYTSDFFKSKMYKNTVKDGGGVLLLKMKNGDWIEDDQKGSRDLYLDELKKPIEGIKVPYGFLEQCELERRLKRARKR